MNYGVLERDVFTAPNAVDTELFAQRAEAVRQEAEKRRQALQLPPRFFLFVGRLVREKGVFDLLEAYGKLTLELRTLVSLVLVGEGIAREEVTRRARQIVPGQVRCAGFVQRDHLADYYALAEGFVFPTHSDTWGLVVNEAMTQSRSFVPLRGTGSLQRRRVPDRSLSNHCRRVSAAGVH